jgi:hypothetical protein
MPLSRLPLSWARWPHPKSLPRHGPRSWTCFVSSRGARWTSAHWTYQAASPTSAQICDASNPICARSSPICALNLSKGIQAFRQAQRA